MGRESFPCHEGQGKSSFSNVAAQRPAHRRDFEQLPISPQALSKTQFMSTIGGAPKTKQAPPAVPGLFPEDEPAVPLEEMEMDRPDLDPISHSLPVQQKALTSLVAQIAQDGLHELGAGSFSSAGLSLKGFQKRDTLIADFASKRGISPEGSPKRLQATEANRNAPSGSSIFPGQSGGHLERQGGFGGQRDLGLVMWLLCNMAI